MHPGLKRVLFVGGGVASVALVVVGLLLGYPLAVILGLVWLLGTWGSAGFEMMLSARSTRVRRVALIVMWLGLIIFVALVVFLVATDVWETPQDWLRKHRAGV
jgi:hypothetical protein